MVDARRGGRSKARLPIVLLLAAVCFVAVWWRSPPRATYGTNTIHALPITATAAERRGLRPFELTGAWRLRSIEPAMSGLSGLTDLPDGRLLAVSDRGAWVILPVPGGGGKSEIRSFAADPRFCSASVDAETVTADPASGRIWFAMETANCVARFSPDLRREGEIRPPIMKHWHPNVGAEAMLRLPDGRFIVIGEGRTKDRQHAVLLFRHDPLRRNNPKIAILVMPGDYRPVGLAGLPDGRVLILGRDMPSILKFRSIVLVADPRELANGRPWPVKEVARIDGGPLADNYEGIAVTGGKRGKLNVWLVSDNNQAQILQSTNLLRLEIDLGDL